MPRLVFQFRTIAAILMLALLTWREWVYQQTKDAVAGVIPVALEPDSERLQRCTDTLNRCSNNYKKADEARKACMDGLVKALKAAMVFKEEADACKKKTSKSDSL